MTDGPREAIPELITNKLPDEIYFKEEQLLTHEQVGYVRKSLLQLVGLIERAYVEIGAGLHIVLSHHDETEEPLWRVWGYDSFDDYCRKELGFRERKGYYILGVWKSIIQGVFTKAAVESIGWTKASVLAELASKGIIDQNNSSEWIESAETTNYFTLREMAKAAKKKAKQAHDKQKELPKPEDPADEGDDATPEDPDDSDDDDEMGDEPLPETPSVNPADIESVNIVRFGLYDEQYKVWEAALKYAQKLTGSDKLPAQVECIIASFMSECAETSDELAQVLLERIEKTCGLRIMAIKDDDGELIYGNNYIEDE